MKTIATLFSGGGGVEAGAMAAGYTPIWAVEYDAAIGEAHRQNFPGTVHTARVQDVDPYTLDRPDVLHASPPCTTASVANNNGGETAQDMEMAEAVCHFLRVLTPPVFTLENVMGYRSFASYQRILCTLDELGYWTHSDILNAADYGVPQTRKRLILRAVRDGFPLPLPSPAKWVGWYAAIEDLLPTLPESKFADWQLKRLPDELVTMLFNGMDMKSTGRDMQGREAHEPSATVTADDWRRPSTVPAAILVEGDAAGDRPPTTLLPDSPAFTIKTPSGGRVHRAFIVEGSAAGEDNKFNLPVRSGEQPVFTMRGRQNNPRAWLEQGRVVSMTPQALARFQSFPDSYLLPEKAATAVRVIGNAVPPKLYEAILATV